MATKKDWANPAKINSLKLFGNECESFLLNESFHKVVKLFLQENHAAVFYIDLDYHVVMQDGHEQFLQQLNALNLTIGTNLSEKLIGTNAVTLASRTQKKSYLAGPEHLSEALRPYDCIGSPIFMANHIPIAYVMYVAEASVSDHGFYDRLQELIDLQNYLTGLKFSNLELALKNEMFRLDIDSKQSGTILIDGHGLILSVDEWIPGYFHIERSDMLGRNLQNVLPDLLGALDCFQSGEELRDKEIGFSRHPGKNSELLMSCHLLKQPDKSPGMIICLSDNKPSFKVSTKKTGHDARFTFNDLIGVSVSFREAKKMAEVASVSDCNVMIIGESGSGKELFAQSIHNKSNRKGAPFVSINCAAIPKDLIYSELFGYVEGAFTGARKGGAPGKFELANNGTLFLDEISEIPNEMQAVLLRVLEEDSVSRLGSSVSIPINVRIIAATNRNICNSVASDEFRLDLYHRLCTVRIDIPPLRRRRDDILVLADYFLQVFNAKHNKHILRIAPEAMIFLQHCLWLGNVRELRNVMERGVIFCSSEEITMDDLPKELLMHHKVPKDDRQQSHNHLGDNLQQQFQQKLDEKNHIELLLKKYNNNKTLVAQELGITRATLYRRLKSLGIS